MKTVIFLAAFVTIQACAQPVCPAVNFQQLAQVKLQNRPQKILSGMLRQADQSFSQIEITGNIQAKTTSLVGVVSDIQASFFTCSGLAARNPGSGPAPSRNKDPLGTGSRNTIITDLAGDGVGAIVGLEPHAAPGQVVVVTAKPDFTVRYAGGFTVGLAPLGVVAGDFNGDGKHDIAAVYFGPADNSAPGGISLLLGSGDGDLEPAVNYPVGLGTIAATVWDFNGDGKDDLAVANYQDNTVTILFGAANGKLTTGQTYKLAGFPSSIAVADVNGDGIPDLLVSTFDDILTLLGNGDGTFRTGPATTIHTTQSFIATGDFNKDGKVDVALADSASGFVHILQGNGDGTFNEVAQYLVGNDATAFYVEDFDRDGNLDLVFAAGHPDALITLPYTQTVGVLFGKGDGTFVGAPVYDAAGDANTIVAADFNGDGKLDLAVSGQILLGSGGSAFETGAALYGPRGGYAQSATADINGDGKVDLIVNNQVFLGNGDGTFQAPVTIPAGNETSGLAIGDFNNDHKVDLAIANLSDNSVTFAPGNGDGTFGAGTTIPVGSNPIYLLAGDFNHDGKLDLAVANFGDSFSASDPGGLSILLGKGDGTFESAVSYPVSHPNSISSGDFNNDGIIDLIVTGAQPDFSYALSVFIGNGDGTFKPGVPMPTDFGPHNVAVADFNGDGKLDLVVPHCCGDTTISYLLGNGDGTFQKEAPITTAGALASVVADFNGDGKPDVAFAVSGEGYGGNAFVFVNLTSASGGCSYALGSTSVQSSSAGGNVAVTIQTASSCSWSVTGLPGWITVSGPSSGKGSGSVTLVVAANSGAARSASVSIAGVSVTVNQAGSSGGGCTYAISAGGQAFNEAGGNGSVSVTVPAGCQWTASGAPSWVTISSGASGNGNGSVTFQVQANASGADRSAALTIAGQTFTIDEASPLPAGVSLGSMAQIAVAGGWKITITLVNTGTTPARARLNFFDNNGNPLVLPLSFPQAPLAAGPLQASTFDQTLNAGAVLVIESTGPASIPDMVGWAQLLSSSGIGGYAIFTETASNQEAVVPLETRNASSYLLAFDDTGSIATGLAIANVGASPNAATVLGQVNAAAASANVPVIIRNDSGTQIGTESLALGSQQHTSFLLAPQYAVTKGVRGTVEFDTPAGSQISVLGLRSEGPALTTIPVLAGVGTGGGSMAHVASGGGWGTTFTLVNVDTVQAQATLSFFDDSGHPLNLPLTFPQTGTNQTATSVTKTLAPGASLVIEAQGPAAQTVVSGSAQLSTAGKVGGFAIFRYAPTGQEAVVPLETRAANAYVLAFDNTNGLATGLALANLSAQAVSVPVVLRDDQGASLGSPSINLPANGHTSFLLAPIYAATAGKRGTIEFDTPAGGKIAALGLRATPSGTLTTVPVLVK